MKDLIIKYENTRDPFILFTLRNHPKSFELFHVFLVWYQQGIFKVDQFYYQLIQLFSFHIYLFLQKGREMIKDIIECIHDQEINDEWVLYQLSISSSKEEQMIYITYLILPFLFYSEEQIDITYDRLNKTLDLLLESSPIPLSIQEYLIYFPIHIPYFYCYLGKPTKPLLEKYSKFIYRLVPELNQELAELKELNQDIKVEKVQDIPVIGIFSRFLFQNHSVCRDRIGIVKHLCRKFKVYLIVTDHSEPKEFFNLNMKNVPFDVLRLHTIESIKTIKNKFSILIFPELGMCTQTFLYSHLKLAPIQITTWGHSETSGIEAIDYYISSSLFDVKQIDFSEQLIPLSSLSTYYYPMDYIEKKQVKKCRETFEFKSHLIYYGILQHMLKIHPIMIKFMKNILKDEKTVFVITAVNVTMLKRYLISELTPYLDRILIFPCLPNEAYFELVQAVDILIDTHPFGGCNTSLDAFYVGKIVMTFPGPYQSGQFTNGFYKKMGIHELISTSFAEWIDKTIYYSYNIEERNVLENKIKSQCQVLFRDINSRVEWEETLLSIYSGKKMK